MPYSFEPADPAALFDALADEYTEVRSDVDWDPFPHVREAFGEGPFTGQRVLDVGCGPGEVMEWFAERGAQVVGVDASVNMCTLAAERVAGARCLPYRLGATLPFGEGVFDAVLALGCLEYVEDVDDATAALARVVRPGGTVLYVVELCGEGLPGGMARRVRFLDAWERLRQPLDEVRAQAERLFATARVEVMSGYLLEDAELPDERVIYGRVIGIR